MPCDQLTDKQHSENGHTALDEISMLAIACEAYANQCPEMDKRHIPDFCTGAGSILKRASDYVLGLVARFDEKLKEDSNN